MYYEKSHFELSTETNDAIIVTCNHPACNAPQVIAMKLNIKLFQQLITNKVKFLSYVQPELKKQTQCQEMTGLFSVTPRKLRTPTNTRGLLVLQFLLDTLNNINILNIFILLKSVFIKHNMLKCMCGPCLLL